MRILIKRKKSFGLLFGVCSTIVLAILIHPAWSGKTAATADKGKLTASLDKTTVKVGDTVYLDLRYRLPQGASLQQPPRIGGLKGLGVIDQTVRKGQIRLKLFVDQLKSWKSDPLTLSYKDKAGDVKTLTAAPVALTIYTVLGKKSAEAQLRPIQNIIPITGFWHTHWPMISISAGLALLLMGAYLWYRQHQHRKVKMEVMDPPYMVAQNAIQDLDKQQMFEKGQVKTFYFIFSEILRRYLGAIRNFPAVEYTTEEISRYMKNDSDRLLLTLLRQADLVKFAEIVPSPARKEQDIQQALSYIDNTRPVTPEFEKSSLSAQAKRSGS